MAGLWLAWCLRLHRACGDPVCRAVAAVAEGRPESRQFSTRQQARRFHRRAGVVHESRLPSPRSLLHPACRCRLDRARLDARHFAKRVQHQPGQGRRVRSTLLAGRRPRFRHAGWMAGRSLDEKDAAWAHLRQRHRHGAFRACPVRRRQCPGHALLWSGHRLTHSLRHWLGFL